MKQSDIRSDFRMNKGLNRRLLHEVKVIGMIITLTFITSTFGFACSSAFQGTGAMLGHTSLSSSSGEETINTSAKTAAVPILSQAYSSLLSSLQVPTPSSNTINEFKGRFQTLSDTGRANTVGAPTTLAFLSLAGQVCLDRISFEAIAANPKDIFSPIDLNALPAATVTESNLKIVINKLARSFWQRNETEAEQAILIQAVKDSMALDTTENANKTKEAVLFLCTAMATSLSGIQF